MFSDGNNRRSQVIFDPIEVEDKGAYTCTIRDLEDGPSSSTTSVLLFVEEGECALFRVTSMCSILHSLMNCPVWEGCNFTENKTICLFLHTNLKNSYTLLYLVLAVFRLSCS